MFFHFLFVVSSVLSLSSLGAAQQSNAEAAFATLQQWYNTTSGLWDTTGWWNSANCLTVIGDLAALDSTVKSNVTAVYANTLVQAQKYNLQMTKIITLENFLPQSLYGANGTALNPPNATTGITMPPVINPKGFLNGFYDDEGWWAHAWIQAYDVTNDADYLTVAVDIFEDMKNGSEPVCGGGIWWDKANTYVNAIANELYLSVASHLANRIPANKTYYEDIAVAQYNWFYSSGMINSDNLINDGLTSKCVNNGQTVWSYNQGVILGGLVELSTATGNTTYLNTAKSIASAAIKSLGDSNGVLHDSCEPNCGADGSQFKGVFMRNLQKLQSADADSTFLSFIETNEAAIWSEDRDDSNNELSVVWSGPFVSPANASTQSSAMDAIVAALAFSGTSALGA